MQVQNCYRIKIDVVPGTVAPTPKQKEIRPRQSQTTFFLASTEQEASDNAAYRVADAENKTFVAAEASKEKERVSKLADNANDVLVFAQDIFDQCKLLYPTLFPLLSLPLIVKLTLSP